ncbi:hypothetical protein E2562_033057 [Oryza meyeriana var. granulata]|uniref:Uncharacterized protein n=1 Tax=Oryza meyeriana var. granulata TaxID=110450 RepID=A0A6G1DRC6_9ORYZ|nr:hypothetical protein E2562_033057 [Oryza meyeriana var. granulata]
MDPSPGGLQRRPAAAAAAARGEGAEPPRGQRVLHGDIDPPPRARPGMQKLAIAAIVVLGCLQFLPATHFRDPADPQRTWIPFDRSRYPVDLPDEVGSVNVFSWISCLDLRTLAVLTNSTLSSSSDPHNISFNFLIPERGTDKSPYYKLKAVLPDSNVTVASQKKIEDKLNVATPEGNLFWSFPDELSPIIIGTTQFSQKRYVYISADSIVKGKVEDLGRIGLGTYAIGAAEDCTKHVGDYVSMDVLHAVQKTAPKNLVYTEPYDKDACLLDFDVFVVEPRKLRKDLIDSIMVWFGAFSLANPRDQIRLAITLAFYDNYLKLPSSWKHADANSDILNYDGPKKVCSEGGRQLQEQGYGDNWQQYLDQKSIAVLS